MRRVVFSWPVASSIRQLAIDLLVVQVFAVLIGLEQQGQQVVLGVPAARGEQRAEVVRRLPHALIGGQVLRQVCVECSDR